MIKLMLCSVWLDNGGEFEFSSNSIQSSHGVTGNQVVSLYQGIKTICDSVAQDAFSVDAISRNLYSSALFGFFCKHLSIQTLNGLKAYLMLGSRVALLTFENGTIRINRGNGNVSDGLQEVRSCLVFLMQICNSQFGNQHGIELFKSLLPKVEIV